jgi:hypothetical protein
MNEPKTSMSDLFGNRHILTRRFDRNTGEIISLPDKLAGVFLATSVREISIKFPRAIMGAGSTERFSDITPECILINDLRKLKAAFVLFIPTDNVLEADNIVSRLIEMNSEIETLYVGA